jgi:hypothetical protein
MVKNGAWRIPFLHIYNKHADATLDQGASGIVEISLDDATWTAWYSSTPERGPEQLADINNLVKGHQRIYLRARLYTTQNPIAAQFLRCRANPDNPGNYRHRVTVREKVQLDTMELNSPNSDKSN